ncbi:MAG: cytochrome c biogenesis protein CcsA [Acidobacteriota bacterium]|nr:cytochrome c biogenesis protein CcsA [Acidobacteriota bacterium]
MFEAVIASAWFGGVVALVLEWVLRRQRLRLLPALCASAYAMVAMMFGNFMTVTLSSDITTVMPVLDRTIWLYIHTNVVIASYALIFFASVTAVLYLVFRGLHRFAPGLLGSQWGPTIFARGGASSVILGRQRLEENAGLARTLDGATMVFLEVAFIALWVGTVLGAVWADVSWGRPWGWDPKEVFALNTWLVFLVLLHVRIKVQDKALWTAILAVVGCAVMIFNWVAVNFVIVGLHSYA